MGSELNIAEMNLHERLAAMEALWDSLRSADAQVESPDWHGEVLAARKKLVESGGAEFLSLEEVAKRLGISGT